MTLQAIIVDDEELARERIRGLLQSQGEIRVLSECSNGREAVEAIEQHHPDLVFLDIQMPDLDGFGVIETIGVERMPPVIFITAFDRYAVNAFEASAVDYLLKPFDRERFRQAIDRALKRHEDRRIDDLDQNVHKLLELAGAGRRYDDRLVVRSGTSVHFVKAENIDWIESARNYVKIHSGAEVYQMRETMAHIETRLDPERFLRIHRSTLINVDRIKKLEPGFGTESIVELEGGARLIVSRAYRRGKLKELLSA